MTFKPGHKPNLEAEKLEEMAKILDSVSATTTKGYMQIEKAQSILRELAAEKREFDQRHSLSPDQDREVSP